MKECLRPELYRMNFQTIQDYLSEKSGLFAVLVDDTGQELTLPSGMPVACCDESSSECKRCYLCSIAQFSAGKGVYLCLHGLYCGINKTALSLAGRQTFLCFGRTPNHKAVTDFRTVVNAAFSFPLSLKSDWSPYEQRGGNSILTAKEKEVLKFVSQGWSNREIASALFVSESTVKTHISHILGKLDARNRNEALSIAIKQGIVG